MEKRPVIVQINTQARPGTSVGDIMHAVDEEAKRQGFDSRIVAGYGWRQFSDVVLESRLRYLAYALRHRRHGDDGFIEGEPTRRLLMYLNRVKPDIVHLHNMHGYYLDMPALCRWLVDNKVKTVATAHDLWWLTGRCAAPGMCPAGHDGRSGCENCGSLSTYPGVFKAMPPRYKARYLAPVNAGIVVPSQATAEIFGKSVLAHLPLTVIENGVDKAVFRPQGEVFRHSDKKLNLLAVAPKWTDAKNPEALRRLVRVMPEDWHLTIVGSGSGVHGKNVRHLPRVSHAEMMARIYRGADVLLSPSLSESFGMTVAEANACGIPAVVNSYAVPAVTVTEGNVFSVPFGETGGLMETIESVMHLQADPGKVFSKEEMAGSYVRLYQQLLGGR